MTFQKTSRVPPPPPVVDTRVGGVPRTRGGRADTGGESAMGHRHHERALQCAAVDATPLTDAPPIVDDTLHASGAPLDGATRAFMEARFGHDFSQVRVHTDAEAAGAVNARAYAIGPNVIFAPGQYRPATETFPRLLAHELTHVVQQRYAPVPVRGASLKVGDPGDPAEREADRVADLVSRGVAAPQLVSPHPPTAPAPTLRRQPTTTVEVESDGSKVKKQLTQGKGGSGAIVYTYSARAQTMPKDKDPEKDGTPFNITLPVLVYPPAIAHPPKVDVFVLFHGMRADYEEGGNQGSEPIALWTHLQEAVAGTDRVGIAPQAPATSRRRQKQVDDPTNKGAKKTEKWWEGATAQWQEALTNVGFDGLINMALEKLSRDLGITPALVPGTIHVAGHSAGGLGIIEATSLAGGAKTHGDKVQDVTLQDAGYGWGFKPLMDWLLDGSPGKTVRVLISRTQGGTQQSPGDTRAVIVSWFNAKKITDTIAVKKKSDTLEVETVSVPAPKDQKPRPGGFVLESHLVVKNKKTGVIQGTVVAFFAPQGAHYETATASMGAAAAAGPKVTTDFLGEAKPGKYRVISTKTGVFEDKDLSKPVMQTPSAKGAKPKALELPLDTMVEVTVLELQTPKAGDKTATQGYLAKIKADGVEGWTPLASLAQPTPPH